MLLDTYQKARYLHANGVIFNTSTAAEVEWRAKHQNIHCTDLKTILTVTGLQSNIPSSSVCCPGTTADDGRVTGMS